MSDHVDTKHLHSKFLEFEETGVEEVDQLLAAVGLAARSFHNTAEWVEEDSFKEGMSFNDLIQQKAFEVAELFE